MTRVFDSYIIVDWSAETKPKTGADSIWVGVVSPDARRRPGFEAFNPPTRAQAEKLIAETLTRLRRRNETILVGFDFSLGYPAGTAAALGLTGDDRPAWSAMHHFLASELKDKPDNDNNRFPLAARMNRLISGGPFPFWGVPAKGALTTLSVKKSREHAVGELAEFRHTELHARANKGAKPKSVWQLAYAGNVGSQTMTGIPVVRRLRAAFAEARVWPFETGWATLSADVLGDASIVFAEVYPSLLPVTPQPGEIKDAAQVRTLAEGFQKADAAGKLAAMFAPPPGTDETLRERVESEEGWILGV